MVENTKVENTKVKNTQKYFIENMEKIFDQETLVSLFSCADYAVSLEDFVENILETTDNTETVEQMKIKVIFDYFRKEETIGGSLTISGFKSYIKKKINNIKPKLNP